MAKVEEVTFEGQHHGWRFFCPGCQCNHMFDNRWRFNGDVQKPTFSPSLLCTAPGAGERERCHSFVTDGMIQFLSDCSHGMKGKTIPLEELS